MSSHGQAAGSGSADGSTEGGEEGLTVPAASLYERPEPGHDLLEFHFDDDGAFGPRELTQTIGTPSARSRSPTRLEGTGRHEPYGDETTMTRGTSTAPSQTDGCDWWIDSRSEVELERLRPGKIVRVVYYALFVGLHSAALVLRRQSGYVGRWDCVTACGAPCGSDDWWDTAVDFGACGTSSAADHAEVHTAAIHLSALNRRVHVVAVALATGSTATATLLPQSLPPTATTVPDGSCGPLAATVSVTLCRGGAATCSNPDVSASAFLSPADVRACQASGSGLCWGPGFAGGGTTPGDGLWTATTRIDYSGSLDSKPAIGVYLLREREEWVAVELAMRYLVCVGALGAAVLIVYRLVRRGRTAYGPGPAASGFAAIWAVVVLVAAAFFANPLHNAVLHDHSVGGLADAFEDWGTALWLFSVCAFAVAMLDLPRDGQRVLSRDDEDGVPRGPLDTVSWTSAGHLCQHSVPLAYFVPCIVFFAGSGNSLPFVSFHADDWVEFWPIAMNTVWNFLWMLWAVIRISSTFSPVTGVLWGLSVVRNRALGVMLVWTARRLLFYAIFEVVIAVLHRHDSGFYRWPWSGAFDLPHSTGELVAVCVVCFNVVLGTLPASMSSPPPRDWLDQLSEGVWSCNRPPGWLRRGARCVLAQEAEHDAMVQQAMLKTGKYPPPLFCFETCARLLAASWEVYGSVPEYSKDEGRSPRATNPQSGGQKRSVPADFRSFLNSYVSEKTFSIVESEPDRDLEDDIYDVEEDRCVVVDMGAAGVMVVFRGTMMSGKTAGKNWRSNLLACWESPGVQEDDEQPLEDVSVARTAPPTPAGSGLRSSLVSSASGAPPARSLSQWTAPRRSRSRMAPMQEEQPADTDTSADDSAGRHHEACYRCRECRCGCCWCPAWECSTGVELSCWDRLLSCSCRCKTAALAHRGFRDTLSKLLDQGLLHHVTRLMYADGTRKRCYVTGHSRGGALATLFAFILSSSELTDNLLSKSGPVPRHHAAKCVPGKDIVVYTFGSPRTGNDAFAHEYNSKVPHSFRVIGALDPVAEVPQSWMTTGATTFKHVGIRVVLNGVTGDLNFVRGRKQTVAEELLFGPFNMAPRSTLSYHRVVGGETSYFSGVLRAASEAGIEVPERSALRRLLTHLAVWNPMRTDPWLFNVAEEAGLSREQSYRHTVIKHQMSMALPRRRNTVVQRSSAAPAAPEAE
eukprot:TRINITY_DN29729_c0_g1_i1.p1 TRINITY_DN29729_c0_g1~~TRINITY_DN29729_c0_g1_i1.p1  ORF type:complete len:1214 (+),score=378.79 TRINITY_DN29729_c0_g1_i1:57-3644(+)